MGMENRIDRGKSIFKCRSELHQEVSYQSTIKSNITKCLLEEQPESDERRELIDTIKAKIKKKFSLASLRQDPSKVGFEKA